MNSQSCYNSLILDKKNPPPYGGGKGWGFLPPASEVATVVRRSSLTRRLLRGRLLRSLVRILAIHARLRGIVRFRVIHTRLTTVLRARAEVARTRVRIVLSIVRTRLVAIPVRPAIVRLVVVAVAAIGRTTGLAVPRAARAHMTVGRLRDGAILIEADGTAVASATIGAIDRRRLTEVVAAVVARVDAEHPRAAAPDGGLVEINSGDIPAILPRVQHKAQVGVAAVPIDAEHILFVLYSPLVALLAERFGFKREAGCGVVFALACFLPIFAMINGVPELAFASPFYPLFLASQRTDDGTGLTITVITVALLAVVPSTIALFYYCSKYFRTNR